MIKNLARRLIYINAAFLLLTALTVHAESQEPVDRIITEFNLPDSNQVLVVAHRGDWRNHPENSISCIKSCIKMGVDMVELDVRKTKDGVFVLMHDGMVNRTTNGKGHLSSFTLKELKQLRLKEGQGGKLTNEPVPTLEEALTVAKGKIMINIDKAGVSPELLALIDKSGTTKQILFKSGATVETINNSLKKLTKVPQIHFMPIVKKGGIEAVKNFLKLTPRPKAVELVFAQKESPFNSEKVVKSCRKIGLRPWVNTLWASLCAGQHDAKAIKDSEKIWGGLIKKGYNIIQTDNPKELLEYLNKKGLHNFNK